LPKQNTKRKRKSSDQNEKAVIQKKPVLKRASSSRANSPADIDPESISLSAISREDQMYEESEGEEDE